MDNITAQNEFEKYLNRRSGDRSTPLHYCSDVRIFLETMNQKSVDEIEKRDIDRFIESQYEKGMSGATIRRRLASLRVFFEFLAMEEPDEEKPNPVRWCWHGPWSGR